MQFESIKLEDKPVFDKFFAERRYENSWFTFTNLFVWRNTYSTEWTRFQNGIVIKYRSDGQDYFLPPFAPSEVTFASLVDRLAEEVASTGAKFLMQGMSDAMLAEIEGSFPGKYVSTPLRDRYDYLYRAEDLRELAGRRYHAKRNHVNRFRAENPDWHYEPLQKGFAEECLQVASAWCGGRSCEMHAELQHEYEAISEAFTHYEELGLIGGLVRIGGKAEAFTLGEYMNEDTVVVHIEKADPAITGLYPVINQEFCRRLEADVAYVNREEDMGNEGLRKAKESYYPVKLVEKHELTIA